MLLLSLVRALALQLVAHRLLCEESKLEFPVEHDQQPSVGKPHLPRKLMSLKGRVG